MKSKQYGIFTVLVPDQEEIKTDPVNSASPVVKNTVYQVRIDDEAYLEMTIEDQQTPVGLKPAVLIFARKAGNPNRKYICSIFEQNFGLLEIKENNGLSDEAIFSIYRRIFEEEEELFWLLYHEAFGQQKTSGGDR